jgi:hypothetical protein
MFFWNLSVPELREDARKTVGEYRNVLSESFMHLPLRPIFRQSHPNFRGGRNANASKIWAQLTKNLLAKSSTKRFREYIERLRGKRYVSAGDRR